MENTKTEQQFDNGKARRKDAGPQFDIFNKLPTEMRDAIWDAACKVNSSTIQVRLVKKVSLLGLDPPKPAQLHYMSAPSLPVLLDVCTAAKERVFMNFTLVNADTFEYEPDKRQVPASPSDTFYVNFKCDVFYIKVDMNVGVHQTLMVEGRVIAPKIFEDIRHLAIDLDTEPMFDSVSQPGGDARDRYGIAFLERRVQVGMEQFLQRHVRLVLQYFPKLKTLAIVIPEKKMGWRPGVKLISWNGTIVGANSGYQESHMFSTQECYLIEEKMKEWFEVQKVFSPDINMPEVRLRLGVMRDTSLMVRRIDGVSGSQ